MALDKRDVRHSARARRRRLAASTDPDAAGRAIAAAVLALLPATDRPCRVAAYVSLPHEPPTGPLIEALLAAGHEVIVPVTLDDWSLEWVPATPGAVGDAGTVTRLAPDATRAHSGGSGGSGGSGNSDEGWLGVDALAGCDLIVTPGLTVDRVGTRLGQGGGCYDRALVHRDPATPVITLLHAGEASPDLLPRDAHDVAVDGWVDTTGHYERVARA